MNSDPNCKYDTIDLDKFIGFIIRHEIELPIKVIVSNMIESENERCSDDSALSTKP